ncbi:hypothetical protein LUX39_41745 [Actinomadura madurae]|nr:hypothetical protein [Actinomadura madurae]MCP9954032.1 hypothetical protein [Actinomadura madurae]MCP9983249.1 hypothetical protein [Actinomadura madurae]MCQ0005190.1 hypothetical protein [Actinomadura madurae]MCQ0019497.1 hypothetical protein [Actinomadura madurae]
MRAQQFFERDAGLELRQVRADAEVHAAGEAQVTRDLPGDVQLAGGRAELALVPVRRPEQHHHLLALRDLPAVERHGTRRGAGERLHRCLQAEELHQRVRDQGRVGRQPLALDVVAVEKRHAVRDQVAGRVVAARDHDEAEPEDVPVGQALPVHLRGRQRADQVVGRIGAARGDHVGEVGEHLRHGRLRVVPQRREAEPVVLQGRQRAHPRIEPRAVRLGDAQQVGQCEGRDGRREVTVQVRGIALRRLALHQPDPGAGELAEKVLQGGDPARGETVADQAPQDGVPRRIQHHDRGGEAQRADLVRIERQTLRGRERVRVSRRRPDVLEARQRPERRIVVVMDRVVVPEPPVRGIGVGLEAGIERVVDVRHGAASVLTGSVINAFR